MSALQKIIRNGNKSFHFSAVSRDFKSGSSDKKVKVKISHRKIAERAVGIRVSLYPGYS